MFAILQGRPVNVLSTLKTLRRCVKKQPTLDRPDRI